MIIEESLTAPRRPLWLIITFTCFSLIVGASIASILYPRQHMKDVNQADRILVVSRGYEGSSDDLPLWIEVNSTAKPLLIINPFTAGAH